MSRDLPITDDSRTESLLSDRQANARLAHVRHELLSPVNAIAGYADILRDEATRLELAALIPDIDRILVSAETLLSLVEGLLDAGTTNPRGDGENLAAFQE